MPPSTGGLVLGGLAAIVVGFGGGTALARRIDPGAVRRGTLALAAVGGLAAVVQGLR